MVLKYQLTNQEYKQCALDCIELIDKHTTIGVTKIHIVALYRGGLPFGVKMSNILGAPLSIIDYQSYNSDNTQSKNNKKPVMIKSTEINSSDVIVIVDDICDSGESMRLSEEFMKNQFPNNKILIYTLVGSKEHPNHPEHYNYTIEHNDRWIEFEWETI